MKIYQVLIAHLFICFVFSEVHFIRVLQETERRTQCNAVSSATLVLSGTAALQVGNTLNATCKSWSLVLTYASCVLVWFLICRGQDRRNGCLIGNSGGALETQAGAGAPHGAVVPAGTCSGHSQSLRTCKEQNVPRCMEKVNSFKSFIYLFVCFIYRYIYLFFVRTVLHT